MYRRVDKGDNLFSLRAEKEERRGEERYEEGTDMQPTRAWLGEWTNELEGEKKAPTREVSLYSPHSI